MSYIIPFITSLTEPERWFYGLLAAFIIAFSGNLFSQWVSHKFAVKREFKKNKIVEIKNDRISRHREDIEKLLLAAIDVIDKRYDLTNNIIYDFKDIYKKNSVYLLEHQEKLLSPISFNLHELMSLSTLLSTEPVGEQRTLYVKQQRIILDHLENLIPKINEFRREIA